MSKNDFDKELHKAENAKEKIHLKKAKLKAMIKELEFQEEKNNVSSLYGNSIVNILHKINPDINLRSMSVLKALEVFLSNNADKFNELIDTLLEQEKTDQKQLAKEKKEKAERKKAEKEKETDEFSDKENFEEVAAENHSEYNDVEPVENNIGNIDFDYDEL